MLSAVASVKQQAKSPGSAWASCGGCRSGARGTMDAPSGPPETASAPADLLTALPPDILRRILQAVEGDAPPGSMDCSSPGSPLTPLLLVCKVLSEGAKASITRVHLDTRKHSASILASLSSQLQCLSLRISGHSSTVEHQIQILASHFPNLKKIAIFIEGRLSGMRPSVGPLRVLPHLSQLSVGFSPRGGLVSLADSTHGGASASRSFTPEEGLASLATLEELELWDEHGMAILEGLPPNLRILRVGVASSICPCPAPLWLPPSPSSPARLQTAELRNLGWKLTHWLAPGFPLSSLTSLTLAEVKELPPWIGLKCLSTLSIKDCPVLELDRDDFQGLETLQVLKLQSLPNAGMFPEEESLSSLRYLYISKACFVLITFKFPVLAELVLDQVTFMDNIYDIGGVLCATTSLRRLRITNSSIRGLLFLKPMSQLEMLHLERLPALTSVRLQGVSSLKSVYISQVPMEINQVFDGYNEYPALENLHLEELTQLDVKLIRALQLPPSLRSLTLVALPSELLPKLRHLTRLEELRLCALRPRCALADAGTRPFDKSNLPTSLRRLEVSDVHIRDRMWLSHRRPQ